jgi:Protein of unknown function (DUF742)
METVRYRWICGAAPPGVTATTEPTFSDVIDGFAVVVDREITRPAPDPEPRPVPVPVAPPVPIPVPAARPDATPRRASLAEPVVDEPPSAGYRAPAVRPYLWTHGRTKVSRSFAIETLVSTRARHPAEMARLRLEHRAPAELCRRTRSVGEVAAILSVPLGVACVLIDEMADLGIVVVHTRSALDGPPELALLRRVRDGLQRL